MSSFFKTLLNLVLLFALLTPSQALFGFGDKKKNEEKKKSDVEAGLEAMRASMADPAQMREALDLLKDPETMEEVRKMMKDPKFIADMEKLTSNPKFAESMKDAAAKASDPREQMRVKRELERQMRTQAQAQTEAPDGRSDVEIGLSGLAAAAKDPRVLKDAMESLKDPEVRAEVEKMMKDPKFRSEMERMKNSPQFVRAMDSAKREMEEIAADPVRNEALKRKAERAFGP